MKKRGGDLQQDYDEASRDNDLGRMQKRREEIEAISEAMEWLAQQLAMHGGDTDPNRERARQSARKSIKAALKKIDQILPVLGQHLRTHIKTGNKCMYVPDAERPQSWVL